ncbi:MAG TPA: aminotransferase class V-fold PLP-dependent enzyme, partial [Chlamydiales bacterium]|nr:aminotransferase class V-fold PLP-dependent enzyme [Chlamydiales bacterium]
ETVTFEHTTYNVLPLKFEAGTPIIAEVIGLGAAIDFLSTIGLEKIAAWEHELLNYMTPKLLNIPGLKILGQAPQKGALATFSIEGLHPLDIATMLDLQGIAVRSGHLCAQPTMRHFGFTAAARASLAFYNTKEDIDRFITALHSVIKKLR